MADLTAKKQNFVSLTKTAVENFLDAYEELRSLRQEWDTQGYSGNLGAEIFVGGLAHMDGTKVASVMTTFDAVHNVIGTSTGTTSNTSGHLTNFYAAKG